MIRWFSRHAWLIALIAVLCLFPQALTSQARLNNRVLITGLAIDKVESGYEITAQVVIPQGGSDPTGMSANLDYITERGTSVVEGLKKIAYNIGKIAGLSHTNFIVIGSTMFDEVVTTNLDYFLREAQIPNSCMLLFSDGSAKDEIKKLGELEISVGLGLQKVFIYKQESLNSRMVSLQEFVNRAYSPSRAAVLPQLKILKEGEQDGASPSGAGSTEQSQGSVNSQSGEKNQSNGASQGRIDFFTPFAYFKNGSYKGKIENQEEIIAYLLTQNNADRFDLVIDNVNDGEIYHNASVGLRVSKKHNYISVDFSSGKPVAKISITLSNIKLMEVKNDGVSYEGSYTNLSPYENQTLKKAIEKKIKDGINNVFEKTKAEGVDIFRISDVAYRFNNKNWNNYLLSLANIDDFLANVDLTVDVKVKNFT